MTKLREIQAKARELARSGEFYGWLPIKFELRFEHGYADAREWLNRPATQEEFNRICRQARSRRNKPSSSVRNVLSEDLPFHRG